MAYKATGRPRGRPKMTEEQKQKSLRKKLKAKSRKPVAPKRDPGRPSYEPTQEQRERVVRYIGAGLSQQSIANILGIAYNTLDKYFRFELDYGADLCHAKSIDLLWDSARNGNVSAQKALAEKAIVSSAMSDVRNRGKVATPEKEEKPERTPQLGKRKQEVIDAEKAASGIYAVPSAPRPVLAVNNS